MDENIVIGGICSETQGINNLNDVNNVNNSKNVNNSNNQKNNKLNVSINMKNKLLVYGGISIILLFFLVTLPKAGVSIPIYNILQVPLFLWLFSKEENIDKRGFLFFIPIIVISLNRFISASDVWFCANVMVLAGLYCFMAMVLAGTFSIKDVSLKFVANFFGHVFMPLEYIYKPFQWLFSRSNWKESSISKSLVKGILIAIPCIIFLLLMLSSADMIFSNAIGQIFSQDMTEVLINIFRVVISVIIGCYLIVMISYALTEGKAKGKEPKSTVKIGYDGKIKEAKETGKGDMISWSVVLVTVIILYTVFSVIQVKYLFTGGVLPDGLNFSEYARQGFFQLLFLSLLNILYVLIMVYALKVKLYENRSKSGNVFKIAMIYLCALTMMLLVSSFYRMSLYDSEFGFTRLRLFVYGFLIFEAIGLLITVFYIIKPKFNAIISYLILGITYFMILNTVNVDTIIAERNIDRYFQGKSIDSSYLAWNLSPDAAEQMARFFTEEDRFKEQSGDVAELEMLKYEASNYFHRIQMMADNRDDGLRNYNIGFEKAFEINDHVQNEYHAEAFIEEYHNKMREENPEFWDEYGRQW